MTGLWAWALAAYARPGAQSACLDLQDVHGQCVPYLLWAGWMAAQGRAASDAVLAAGAAAARDWDGGVVTPLRGVRRRLEGVGAEALRRRVKAAELEAEREVMLALEALAGPPGRPADIEGALAAAVQAWNGAADPRAIKLLARMMG